MRKIVDNFEEYALLLLFPLMVAVVFTATLARYLNLFPMFWGEEVARYIMVFMAYIGAGLGMKKGAHVGVSFFTDRFRNVKIRIFLEGFRLGIIVFFCGMIMYYYRSIIVHQISMGQTTPALYIPMWVPYSAVPLGMFLVALRAFQAFRETTASIRSSAHMTEVR
ncbi:MAG TPA: TRAP transporter small permease [Aminivibrio sp.]|jgi:C4-dicarboxylate transporter DctQ subunit|uniref:TRAP transporter small permease n=1 Tax=Aminivibrio sp. TaxID=1872489 RepID=UPI002B1EAC5B|nr:TRAP transporter small permease [Aminivibrio sp.]MEA4953873.1 TRAP transporter small permease [Aminivibrio sp.]NCB14780.1 TRAP transporter small permease [Synergistales bacterium]HPF83892.1 TRAP transporter small permease [Aminivibrio sp.]HRX25358.1 TRAP transporter small permease [Aminivibrio sp.]